MIVAFDPGVSTGIAILTDRGEIVATHVERTPEDVEAKCIGIKVSYPDADVVAESPPLHGGNYRAYTQQIEEIIRRYFPDATWVNPGQWKGHPAARPDSSMRGKTQHEKDTVGLGRWLRSTRSERAARPSGG